MNKIGVISAEGGYITLELPPNLQAAKNQRLSAESLSVTYISVKIS
jgi:hypothetical protein